MSIAVLGGGISGLSAAYYLSRAVPSSTKITLIEGKHRLGGWIQTHRVSPTVLFESGCRTLRPQGANGAILLEMIQHLQLNNDRLISVEKSNPAISHKYIYYHDQINALPTTASSAIVNSPPILKSVITAALSEPFKPSRFKDGVPVDGIEDESIYSFMKRRFNEHIALNLVGAITHGIYAGDIKQLSLQSTFRNMYEAERNYGSLIVGLMKGGDITTMRERGMAVRSRKHDMDWFARMEKMAIIAFQEGMETLPQHMEEWLEGCPNVEIVKGHSIESIQCNDKETKIKTQSGDYYADHTICTLPSSVLDTLIEPDTLPHLSHNPSADVAVVNYAYSPEVELDYDGFGFLTPHRDTKYPIPVPGTLGVIFDSNVFHGNDHRVKVTAMIGGADWKDAFGNTLIDDLDPEVANRHTRDIMSQFLNIHDDPEYSMVHLQKQCIPQYMVHHESRMRDLHHALKKTYGHLLSVTGASYLGVSVPDCIKNSRMLVEELVVSGALGSREKVVTGLGKVVEVSSTEMKDSGRLSKSNREVIMHS
ncbi:protoporphyrinogen oxidase [Pilobolus umbonatus]|nr:protoporphyrinogen oxidase [Pilobolus umbonatus]